MNKLTQNPDDLTPEQLRDIRESIGQTPNTSPTLYGGESDNDRAKNLHHHTEQHETRDQRNFDQKIYMFPESYNQLRKELFENWKTLWALVGWRMAYRHEEFIELMNDATGLAIVLDSDKVDWTCEQYLKKLRQLRGLSQ